MPTVKMILLGVSVSALTMAKVIELPPGASIMMENTKIQCQSVATSPENPEPTTTPKLKSSHCICVKGYKREHYQNLLYLEETFDDGTEKESLLGRYSYFSPFNGCDAALYARRECNRR